MLGMLVKKWIGGAGNLMSNDGTGSQSLECWFKKWLGGADNLTKRTSWLTELGMMVKKCLGGSGLASLIDRVEPMGTGQCGRIGG